MFVTKEGIKVGSSWEELGIRYTRERGKTKCPDCKDNRKPGNEHDAPLSFVDEHYAKCHNCGAEFLVDHKDYMSAPSTKEYKLPEQKTNYTGVSQHVKEWFETRQISEETLKKLEVTSGLAYMPQVKSEVNTIQFNYFDGNVLTNIKYRDKDKNFKMYAGAKLIFYNLNALYETSGDIVITEGEIDAMSYIEAGVSSVISVPNGASKGSMNLDFLTNHYHLFENDNRAKLRLSPLKRIIIATDDDDAGHALKKEIIRRIGADRCWIADLQGCNDPNELLVKKGKVALFNSFDLAKPAPITDVKTVYDLQEELQRLSKEGLKPGFQVGSQGFKDLYSFEQPRLTILTGVSTHGKSEFLDDITARLAIDHNWRFGVFSPENFPIEYHISKLASKITGKDFNSLSGMELDEVYDFIAARFFWIYPENDDYTLENILRINDLLISRYGVNGLIIDPWTEIDKIGKNGTEDINMWLSMMNRYKRNKNVHIFLVAHPTKMGKGDDGQVLVPSLMDISGSGHFYNKTDGGITVYRDFRSGTVEVHVNKVKFKHLGRIGTNVMLYNLKNGRYQDRSDVDLNGWDDSNWLHNEHQLTINPEPKRTLQSDAKEAVTGGIMPREDSGSDDLPF